MRSNRHICLCMLPVDKRQLQVTMNSCGEDVLIIVVTLYIIRHKRTSEDKCWSLTSSWLCQTHLWCLLWRGEIQCRLHSLLQELHQLQFCISVVLSYISQDCSRLRHEVTHPVGRCILFSASSCFINRCRCIRKYWIEAIFPCQCIYYVNGAVIVN